MICHLNLFRSNIKKVNTLLKKEKLRTVYTLSKMVKLKSQWVENSFEEWNLMITLGRVAYSIKVFVLLVLLPSAM